MKKRWGRKLHDNQVNNQAIARHSTVTDLPLSLPIVTCERELPGLDQVLAFAQRIGLVEWKAKDFFDEMESIGWRDNRNRPVMKWEAMLTRQKTYWEADGRPMTPQQQ